MTDAEILIVLMAWGVSVCIAYRTGHTHGFGDGIIFSSREWSKLWNEAMGEIRKL